MPGRSLGPGNCQRFCVLCALLSSKYLSHFHLASGRKWRSYLLRGEWNNVIECVCFLLRAVSRRPLWNTARSRPHKKSEEKDVNEPLTTKNQTMGGQQHWREGRLTTYTEAKVGSTQFGRIFQKYFKFKKNTYNFFSGTISWSLSMSESHKNPAMKPVVGQIEKGHESLKSLGTDSMEARLNCMSYPILKISRRKRENSVKP